jgi:signal transduction histidine kinase/putative methionine-R-sulfoxide reductase with GAF domain
MDEGARVADLEQQLAEAQQQRAATAEILRVLSRSPTGLQPVFDTIVQSAARLCHAATAAVFRVEAGMLHHPANYGAPPAALAAARALYPRPVGMDSVPGQAILARAPLQIPDVDDPSAGALVRVVGHELGFRSCVAVPMLSAEDAVGALVVTRREPGLFSEAEVELLQTFAHQAVIAIENVRLFTELKARNHELAESLDRQTATADILRVISEAQTDVRPVFEAIAESAQRLFGAWATAVASYDGELVRLAAARGGLPGSADAARDRLQAPHPPVSPPEQALLTRTVRHVLDVETDPSCAEFRSHAAERGFRAFVSVPMLRGGDPLGMIVVSRAQPGGFAPAEIALLQTFADQAVIAVENARLLTELQARNHELTEALDRQTATADILRVISQAQTHVQLVFEAIADNAMRLLGTWAAAVFRYDGELVSLAAARGGLPGSPDAARELLEAPHRPTLAHEEAVLTRRVHHVVDVETDPACSPEFRRHAAARGVRSFVAVPMLRGSEALGVIAVSRAQPGGFSPAEIALLQTFADQAVIAVENARLLTELQARTAELTRSVGQLTALGEVGQAVSSSLDLETVLTTVVARAVQLSGLDGGVIFEYDEAAEAFAPRAATEQAGALAEAQRTAHIRKGEGAVGRTAVTLEPAQVADITVPGAYEGRLRATLIEAGVRAVLAVPMVREGRLLGCLAVTRNAPGEFLPATIELLRTFGTQSALAIQNARLFREIADKSRQLEAASRHKSEFLANMSHELRTPLNAVIGFSEVLTERMFGDLNDKQDEYLRDIHASGQHLLSLINDILDLSKIEAGRMELELSDFDLPSAIDNAVILVRERAGRKGIALARTLDERVGAIRGDERKLKQVLLNLLSNALKFTPEGGRVEVRAAVADGMVEVSVADTGVGIAPEDQEAVFEEFRQVGTADKKVEGTGLGLTLARKFIELHGGRIWVQSQVGRGATFTFTVPLPRG